MSPPLAGETPPRHTWGLLPDCFLNFLLHPRDILSQRSLQKTSMTQKQPVGIPGNAFGVDLSIVLSQPNTAHRAGHSAQKFGYLCFARLHPCPLQTHCVMDFGTAVPGLSFRHNNTAPIYSDSDFHANLWNGTRM